MLYQSSICSSTRIGIVQVNAHLNVDKVSGMREEVEWSTAHEEMKIPMGKCHVISNIKSIKNCVETGTRINEPLRDSVSIKL